LRALAEKAPELAAAISGALGAGAGALPPPRHSRSSSPLLEGLPMKYLFLIALLFAGCVAHPPIKEEPRRTSAAAADFELAVSNPLIDSHVDECQWLTAKKLKLPDSDVVITRVGFDGWDFQLKGREGTFHGVYFKGSGRVFLSERDD